MPTPPVVSNTGPLIALAKVDQLPILRELFGRIQIARAVRDELLSGSGVDVAKLQEAFEDFIDTEATSPAPPPELALRVGALGDGEIAAIGLALHLDALLIIDDYAARIAAREAGLSITGTAGVLIEAKARGKIPAVLPILQAMRTKGYWLSDALLAAAARLAGE